MRCARCACTNAVEVLIRPREEFVERVHLALIGVARFLGARQPAGHQQIPQLFQAALLAPRGFLGRAIFLDRKRDVRPVERRKPESRLLAMGHRQAAERAAVKGAFERHDEAAVAIVRRHHAIQEHGLDRVLDRLGARVDDEVAGRSRRRDAVQLGLEPQRQRRLILGMRVARGHERQRFENRAHDHRIVFAER